jgi:hypothetical protein
MENYEYTQIHHHTQTSTPWSAGRTVRFEQVMQSCNQSFRFDISQMDFGFFFRSTFYFCTFLPFALSLLNFRFRSIGIVTAGGCLVSTLLFTITPTHTRSAAVFRSVGAMSHRPICSYKMFLFLFVINFILNRFTSFGTVTSFTICFELVTSRPHPLLAKHFVLVFHSTHHNQFKLVRFRRSRHSQITHKPRFDHNKF